MAQYGFATDGKTIVADFPDQVKGKIFLITGPSQGGIGGETAISLARGAPSIILLLGRSLPKVQPIIDAISTINPSITTKFVAVSLDSFSSVRAAAQHILADDEIQNIDVVINNAGVMACPYALTEDGFETQFATNHLSHFLLTNLLMPKILASPSPARIVNVSSWGHLASPIRWDDLDFGSGATYVEFTAYGQSKTANVLFTVALSEKLGKRGSSWSLHPGSINSGLQKYVTPEMQAQGMKMMAETGLLAKLGGKMPERKTLQQGCATTLRAALDPGLVAGKGVMDKDGRGGESCYLSDCQIVHDENNVAGWALDKVEAARLWELSEKMVGEKFVL